jgi:membrane protease YdiL (CAAX protease family)
MGATTRGPALSWLALSFTAAYLLVCSLVWYRMRGTPLGSSNAVVPLALLGELILLAILSRDERMHPRSWDRRAWATVLGSMILFSLLWYFGRRHSFDQWFGRAANGGLSSLASFFYFSGASVILRMVAPLVLMRSVAGVSPQELGYRLWRPDRSGWLYAIALFIAIPAVAFASSGAAFLAKYPLCSRAFEDGTLAVETFLVYQAAYGLIFISGEAFWRGFMAFGLEHRLGTNTLLFMLIPYVVGHFGKPQAESIGAVGAGLFLGWLALRHRSFWLGAAVHWAVALMMDLWAIHRRGIEWV